MDLSLVTSAFETLRLPPPPKLSLLEAQELSSAHYPPFPPDVPALILGLASRPLAMQVKMVLSAVYPDDHPIIFVDPNGQKNKKLGDVGDGEFSNSACLYIPSLGQGTSFESFAEIVAHLRAPDGCPWDREQTHLSLRKHLLEETYETLTAMDENDPAGMGEEFGDLLLQIVLNAQIGREIDSFSINIVIKSIFDKIVRRHPHVFGDLELKNVEGVLQNWERLKQKEREEKEPGKKEKGMLDGVSSASPALAQAQEYQDRAARVGFDWPEIDDVLDKVREEIEEVKKAETSFELASEIGDLFFVLVNLARWKSIDAESALRGANTKFKKRFAYVEQGAKHQGRNLADMTLAEMDMFWNEAKKMGL
jgi:tetrapyrrole methylase family protein / MazG family protein